MVIKISFPCTLNIIFQDDIMQNSIIYRYLITFGDSIFLVKKHWIFKTWTFPSSNRDFAYQTSKFPKINFKSGFLRFQAFIWYQICQLLNRSVCHFITIAKSASQSSVQSNQATIGDFFRKDKKQELSITFDLDRIFGWNFQNCMRKYTIYQILVEFAVRKLFT